MYQLSHTVEPKKPTTVSISSSLATLSRLEDVLGPELDHLLLVRGAGPLVQARVAERQHHLRGEVVGKGRDLQPLVGEHLLDALRVVDVLGCAIGVEVVRAAPGRELDHLVAESGRVVRHLLQRLVVEQNGEEPDLHVCPPGD